MGAVALSSTNTTRTSAPALHVLRYIEWAADAAALSPALAVRMANRGANCQEFVHAYNLALEGYSGDIFACADAGHIRRRARKNRDVRRAARTGRAHSRTRPPKPRTDERKRGYVSTAERAVVGPTKRQASSRG